METARTGGLELNHQSAVSNTRNHSSQPGNKRPRQCRAPPTPTALSWLTTLPRPLGSRCLRLYWPCAAESSSLSPSPLGGLQGSQVAAVSPLEVIWRSSPKCQPRRAEVKEHACPLWRSGHPNATEVPPAQAFKCSSVPSGCLCGVGLKTAP